MPAPDDGPEPRKRRLLVLVVGALVVLVASPIALRLFVYEELLGAPHLVALDASHDLGGDDKVWVVPEGNAFVMGDNRFNAHDSRMWFAGEGGTVPPGEIVGRASLLWMPVDPSRVFDDVAKLPKLDTFDAATRARIDACVDEVSRGR